MTEQEQKEKQEALQNLQMNILEDRVILNLPFLNDVERRKLIIENSYKLINEVNEFTRIKTAANRDTSTPYVRDILVELPEIPEMEEDKNSDWWLLKPSPYAKKTKK